MAKVAGSLRFILGPAGSGKTHLLSRMLVESLRGGGTEYLIVPEQSLVSAESRLAELTEGIDSRGLFVLSFTRLCNLVFRRLGGLCYRYADAGARTVAMWRTLDELSGLLSVYKVEPDSSRRWAEVFLREYTRLRTRGITPAMLEAASRRLPPEHARLAGKLSDLSLVGASYSRLLGELYDDPLEDIPRATELLRDTDFFSGCGVWLDSFDGFTHEQYGLLREALRSARHITVALRLPEGSGSPAFEPVRRTRAALLRLADEVGAKVEEPIVLRDLPRYRSPELALLAASLWEDGGAGAADDAAGEPAGSAPPGAIRIVECGSKYEEAELAAAEIMKFVQAGGRWRDCAVIARNIADYEGIVDAALERAGAPYFLSARIDVLSRPVVKLALAALAVVAGGWRKADIMELLRTGMAGVPPEECDMLEEYLTTWNISGERRWRAEHEWRMNPDGYTDELSPRGERILATVNAVRARIVPPLAKLADSFHAPDGGEGGNIRGAAKGIYEFLIEMGVPGQLEEKEGGLARQLWEAITGALDTIVTVAAGATVTADRFSQLFSTVLRYATVGRIPPAVDCVMVGQSDSLRAEDIKLAVLLGAAEGVFPGKAEEADEVFTSAELRVLREVGIDPRDDVELRASDELLGFYRAAALPAERLVVTYSPREGAGAREEAKPSAGVLRLLAMFPGLVAEKYSSLPPEERIFCRELALEHAAASPNTPEGIALRELLSEDPSAAAALESAKSPLAEPEAQLSPELAAEVFRGDLALTQSRLESYVMCSFSYYCRYMLKLREQPKAEVGGADVGNFVHRVLERFFRRAVLPDGRLDPALTREERAKLADEVIEEYIAQTFGQGEERSARAQNLFRRLRRATALIIENIAEELGQSEFVPCRLELPIGRGVAEDGGRAVEPLRIPLPDGAAAYVYGKIDRVDVYRRGGKVYLRVVDYKTGTKRFSLSDVALGLNLQLLLYLFSLWHGGKAAVGAEDAELLPAGVIYMSAGAPRVDALPGEGAKDVELRAMGELYRSGVFIDDEDILRAMEKELEGKYIPVRLGSGGLAVKGKSSGLCDLAGFGKLMREVEGIVAKIGAEMKSGEASARPLRDSRRDACRFCPYGPVCRTRRRD